MSCVFRYISSNEHSSKISLPDDRNIWEINDLPVQYVLLSLHLDDQNF